MRVLVSTNAMFGHFGPLVPLARSLHEAGHDVLVATEPAFGREVTARGFEAVGVGRDLGDDDLFAVIPQILEVSPEDQDAYARPRVFVELHANNVLGDLIDVVSSWNPDLILRESGEFASWAVAEQRDIPHVTVNVGAPSSAAEWDALAAPWFRDLGGRVGIAELHASSLDRHGLLSFQPAGYYDWSMVPTAAVYRPEFDRHESFESGFAADPYRPLVYVTLGTEFYNPVLMASILDGLVAGEWNVLAATGPQGDPGEVDPLRSDVVVARWVPQGAVLNACAAVVTHAGAGTTIDALIRGVPLVCVPQGADQFHHARRVDELGAGIDLPTERRSPAEVGDAVTQVLADPSYRARAEQLAAETARLPDIGEAVAFLERLAA